MALPVKQRDPELQKIFEQVIPRLEKGESPVKLAKIYKVKKVTLYWWKQRYCTKMEAGRSQSQMTPAIQAKQGEVIKIENKQLSVKERMAAKGLSALLATDGQTESLGQGLRRTHFAILRGINRAYAALGDKNADVKDLRAASQLLGASLDQLIKLHCLPLGPQRVEAFPKVLPTSSNHVHFHSHGGKDGAPREKTKTPAKMYRDARDIGEVIDAEVVTAIDDETSKIIDDEE